MVPNIIRPLVPRSIIGVTFFVFGFFVIAHALDLSTRDILGGLIAGAVGGLTMLVVVIGNMNGQSPELKARLDGKLPHIEHE